MGNLSVTEYFGNFFYNWPGWPPVIKRAIAGKQLGTLFPELLPHHHRTNGGNGKDSFKATEEFLIDFRTKCNRFKEACPGMLF